MLIRFFCFLRRTVRRQSPWLAVLALVLVYPRLRNIVTGYAVAQAPPASAASAAAQVSAQWLNLQGPASKLVLAVLAFAVGLGVVWLALSFVVPVLATWAKGKHIAEQGNTALDFKHTFLNLPRQWQITIFVVCWLGLLFFFGQCWQAASLVQ